MKRRALAYEIVLALAIIFVVGIVFAALTPVWNEIMSVAVQYLGMDTDMANTLNTGWRFYPFFIILAVIVFLILSAMRKQPGEEWLT